jgi:hypothetical protein
LGDTTRALSRPWVEPFLAVSSRTPPFCNFSETIAVRTAKQRGQALIELVIVVPVLFWLMLGTLDFGRVFYTSVGLTNAAREGARRAAVLAPKSALDPQCSSSTEQVVATVVRADFPTPDPDAVIDLACTPADRRTVTIRNYQFQPVTPFIACTVGSRHVPVGTLMDFKNVAECIQQNDSVIRLSASATMPVVNR